MCISGAHSRIRCLKLRLFVHTQVAFVDFLRVSSNFHMVKKESSSCKELKLLSGRVQRFYSLHLSLQSRARSNWLLCLKLSFFKTSAINVECLHRSLEQKLKSDVWHVENVKEKMIQKRKKQYSRNILYTAFEWRLAQNFYCHVPNKGEDWKNWE